MGVDFEIVGWSTCYTFALGIKENFVFCFFSFFLVAKIRAFKCSFDLNFHSLVVEFFWSSYNPESRKRCTLCLEQEILEVYCITRISEQSDLCLIEWSKGGDASMTTMRDHSIEMWVREKWGFLSKMRA